jgi:hypothetical protein
MVNEDNSAILRSEQTLVGRGSRSLGGRIELARTTSPAPQFLLDARDQGEAGSLS